MSKRETTSEGFKLEELLDFKTVAELKDIAIVLGFYFKSGAKKQNIISVIANRLRTEPWRLIRACYIYELEMYKAVIEGNMSVEYAEKSGLLFGFNRFGLVYALKNKRTKKETLHFQKELGEIILPLIQPEIDHRKILGCDLVEKAVIGKANIYGFTDLNNAIEISKKIEERLERKFNEETFSDVLSPCYHQTLTKKDNTNPILSPFASMVDFYPDEEHLTNEKPKEYDLDTLISFGEMPYPVIAIKEAKTLEKILQEQGNPNEGTPQEIIRQLWLDKQEQSQWNRIPEFGKYFLFTDEEKIDEGMKAIIDFINSIPCWRFNGNSSRDLMQKNIDSARRSGIMPKISVGPNMRARGIESFEQLMDMVQRDEELPEHPEIIDIPEIPEITVPPEGPELSSAETPLSRKNFFSQTQPYPTTPGTKKVGRNEPCPCGSGKKYKNCCGR